MPYTCSPDCTDPRHQHGPKRSARHFHLTGPDHGAQLAVRELDPAVREQGLLPKLR